MVVIDVRYLEPVDQRRGWDMPSETLQICCTLLTTLPTKVERGLGLISIEEDAWRGISSHGLMELEPWNLISQIGGNLEVEGLDGWK